MFRSVVPDIPLCPQPPARWCRGLAVVGLLLALTGRSLAGAPEIPPWLPHYDVDIHLDVAGHVVHVRQHVTWTNRHGRPAEELVFNVAAHYKVPSADIGFMAKMMEILRITPSQGLILDAPPGEVEKVTLGSRQLPFHWELPCKQSPDGKKKLSAEDEAAQATALVVSLPRPVQCGETIEVELTFTLRLPQKQGRWGQWKGVTFLSNWLPVLAYYDEHGWQPTPFIPWHQPFFNEAGIWNVRAVLPCDQHLACSAAVATVEELPDGWQRVQFVPIAARDFALLCSGRYQEYLGHVDGITVRVMAFAEHEHYAREMVRIACEALSAYNCWFGRYPYEQFTIAESYFGWNGNECSGLVMIDDRIFNMPHLGEPYVNYLVSHEICHQWWYNVVGTNGYCETWMDEGLATYFSHRLLDQKCGKDNKLLKWPAGLEWLPNIQRESYRSFGLLGTIGRGELGPVVQPMEKFGHVVNLFSMCYDKGSRVVALIEERLGETAFLDFMRIIYCRYYFRILRVADFQRELEAYTGRSWDDFFKEWIYGVGSCDWCVEKVKLKKLTKHADAAEDEDDSGPEEAGCRLPAAYQATILIRQKGEISEPTMLGVRLKGDEGYPIRIPILPNAQVLELEDPPARVETLPDGCIAVELILPCKPVQIAVDPDQVIVDPNPINNFWKVPWRFRFSPIFTFLDETDLTNIYDRWNFTVGPWIFTPIYDDAWFTRDSMFGGRAGVYRTQRFSGGMYTAYRTTYRDLVTGIDGLWDHWPFCRTQVGFVAERRLTWPFDGDDDAHRGVVYGRWIIDYGDSLYLPPMHYVQAFASVQDNLLPMARQALPDAVRPEKLGRTGLTYHLNYLTPYWDPEGGFQLDVTCSTGAVYPGQHEGMRGLQEISGQFALVKYLPAGLGWFSETRVAARLFGAAGLPQQYQLFPLGGENLLRGFDLAQRQGSLVWIASVEWRVPLARELNCDFLDHTIGLRNVYLAMFYDVGDVYQSGQSIGGIAHAVGAGARVEFAWFSFIERSIFRIDVAKTVNADTPWQVWFGIQHPF